jgi:hypothetical protein
VNDETVGARRCRGAAARGNQLEDDPLPEELVMQVPSLVAARAAKYSPTFGEFWPMVLRPHVVLSWLMLFHLLGNPHFRDAKMPLTAIPGICRGLDAERDKIIARARLLGDVGQAAARKENTDVAQVRATGGGFDASLVFAPDTCRSPRVLRHLRDQGLLRPTPRRHARRHRRQRQLQQQQRKTGLNGRLCGQRTTARVTRRKTARPQTFFEGLRGEQQRAESDRRKL